jgi:hypothetical protein
MRNLIHSDDLKHLFTGAALAVAAGLAMGMSVQPPLQDRIMAPQQEIAGGGPRTYQAGDERGVAAYSGAVPEYVIGTNYTRPIPTETQVLAYQDRALPVEVADYAQTAEAVAPARWDDEPADEPLYPSMRGNAFNPSDLPPAPEPPQETASPA